MTFALLLGMFLGVGLSFLLEHLDDRVKLPQDVKRHLRMQCIGFVGDFGDYSKHLKEKNDLVTLAEAHPELSESFRYIRSNILACTHGNEKGTTLLVSSALPSEGKTLIASNVAITLANMEKRVLLVDADLRKPRVHLLFYLKRSPGISDVITGRVSLPQAIVNANVSELKVITSGSKVSSSAELLVLERVGDLVAMLRENFDFVIFDSPPVLSVSDPLALAKHVDGTIVVIQSGTPMRAAQAALERFSEVDVNVYGVVLNRVNIQNDGYYYHYYYRDYYSRKEV